MSWSFAVPAGPAGASELRARDLAARGAQERLDSLVMSATKPGCNPARLRLTPRSLLLLRRLSGRSFGFCGWGGPGSFVPEARRLPIGLLKSQLLCHACGTVKKSLGICGVLMTAHGAFRLPTCTGTCTPRKRWIVQFPALHSGAVAYPAAARGAAKTCPKGANCCCHVSRRQHRQR